MSERSGVVTLLTDFGLRDPFVGIMHGVVLSRAPELRVVDLTHNVPPQDVRAGAFYLKHAFSWFPRGTVHVAVVDPGVGSARRPLAAQINGHLFVGPDNGLLGDVWALGQKSETEPELYEIDTARPQLCLQLKSRTFHGRDVFAPVGAELGRGLRLSEVGPRLTELHPTPNHPVLSVDGSFRAEIVVVDHFGNCITNLVLAEHCPEALERPELYRVQLGRLELPLVRTYADVAVGELCGLVNSFGTLELAQRDGNAIRQLRFMFPLPDSQSGSQPGSAAHPTGLGVGTSVRLSKR